MAEKQLSLERRRHLYEMGAVLMGEAIGMQMNEDGMIIGSHGKWIPLAENEEANLDGLFRAMRNVGLDPKLFRFQQYHVFAANPHHGGLVDLQFPDQLVVKGDRYQGMHQVDLVLKTPWVTATEIVSYSR